MHYAYSTTSWILHFVSCSSTTIQVCPRVSPFSNHISRQLHVILSSIGCVQAYACDYRGLYNDSNNIKNNYNVSYIFTDINNEETAV